MTLEERNLSKEIAEKIKKRFGKECLSAGEFAEYLGLTRQTVYAGIRSKHLPGQRYERSYMVPVDSIALWEVNLSRTQKE